MFSFVKFHERSRIHLGLNQETYEMTQKNVVKKYVESGKLTEQLLQRTQRALNTGERHPD